MTVRSCDCDVHCAPPTLDDLAPFLAAYWRDYFREVGYRRPPGVDYTYPPWADAFTAQPAPSRPEELCGSVVDDADVAVLTSYYGLESHQHPYLVAELARAVNDWLAATWLDADPRFLGTAVIAPQYADAAVQEIERVAEDERFVQVLLPARAWEPYGSQRYWPIWEAAVEAGLALLISYGGSTGTPPTPNGWVWSFFEEYAGFQQVFAAHVASLIANGVFNRHPELRVVVAESGWTWLPSLLWRMDAEWKAARREIPWVEVPPSEYVRLHFRFTTQPIDAAATDIRRALELMPADELLVYGSDYPRTYEPSAEALMAEFSPEQAERVRWRNAAETYALRRRGR